MDVSAGTLATLPVQYPVAERRSMPSRKGELLLASDSRRGDGLSRRQSSNVTVVVVALQANDAGETEVERPVTPTGHADGLAVDPHFRRGLAAYGAVLSLDQPRTLGFYAVA